MQHEMVVDDPAVSATRNTLMSGDVFSRLVSDTAEQRAAGLQTILSTVTDGNTRVVWVGNPLRSALTMERFLLQIVGPEIDLRIERGPAELAQTIAQRQQAETRLLVIVQQPETISPETLDQLGALAGHLGGEAIQVQFLFVGSPATRLPEIARAEIGPLLPPQTVSFESDGPVAEPKRWEVAPTLLLLLAVCVGVLFTLPKASRESLPVAIATPAQSAVPAENGVASLRAQFETFLTERAASLPPLSMSQKDALFDDFLAHHRRE